MNEPRCTGLHHVNLRVPAHEIAPLVQFYSDIVGLHVGPRPPFDSPGVWLYAGESAVVHLSHCRGDDALPPVEQRAASVGHVAVACSGFAAMTARLDDRGMPYRVTEVPLTRQRQIFVRDPSGVGVELIFDLDEGQASLRGDDRSGKIAAEAAPTMKALPR